MQWKLQILFFWSRACISTLKETEIIENVGVQFPWPSLTRPMSAGKTRPIVNHSWQHGSGRELRFVVGCGRQISNLHPLKNW